MTKSIEESYLLLNEKRSSALAVYAESTGAIAAARFGDSCKVKTALLTFSAVKSSLTPSSLIGSTALLLFWKASIATAANIGESSEKRRNMSMIPIGPLDHPAFRPTLSPDTALTLSTLTNQSNLTMPESHEAKLVTTVDFWTYGCILIIIAVVGILANTAVFIVMLKPQMRSCISTLIAGLSCFDTLLLVMCLLIYPAMPYCRILDRKTACDFINYPVMVTYPLSLIAHTGSVCTCVLIAIDRYIASCHPLKTRIYSTIYHAKIALFGVALFSILYNLPAFFEVRLSNEGIVKPSLLRESLIYKKIYKTYLYLIVMILIPVGVMAVCNVMTIRAIRQAHIQRKKMSGRDEKERKTSIMVVVMVMCFILLNLVAFITHCLEGLGQDWTNAHKAEFGHMIRFANLLIAVNSATNFIIYCAFGHKFKEVFVKTFLPFCTGRTEVKYNFLRKEHMSSRFSGPQRKESYGIISMRRMPSGRMPRKNIPAAESTTEKRASSGEVSNGLNFDFSPMSTTKRVLLDNTED